MRLPCFEDLRPRSRILLRRWLWRGASTQQHAGDSGSGRLNVTAVREAQSEDDAVQRLLGLLRRDERPLLLASTYNSRFAHTRLEQLFLLSLGPRHLASGKLLTLDDLREEERLSVVALDHLPNDPRARTIASRFVHPRRYNSHQSRLKQWLVSLDPTPETLRSHGLSEHSFQLLRAGDLPGFLGARTETLTPLFSHFIASKTEWSQSDRASLFEGFEDE